MPSTPDFLLQDVQHLVDGVRPYLFMMNCRQAGSMSPERVPMGTPARGVRPMEVSTHLPSTDGGEGGAVAQVAV